MTLRKHSLRGPVVIFIIVLALTITLTVLWNVVLVHDYMRIRELAVSDAERSGPFHTTFIALGSTFFVAIIVLLSIFGARTFAEIRWRRRQDNFLASVSHELNSPLQSIKLHAQTLARAELDEERRVRFLETLVDDVDRLAALIGNVLRAAQIDQRQLTVHREPLLLRDYLRTYVEQHAPLLGRTAGGCRIELADGVEYGVPADRILVRQLLDNLIDNAIKYSPAGRCEVRIALAQDAGGTLVLSVRDRGIGVPRHQLKRIFDRFYRIEDDDPDRSRKGTGLGLSIVQSIAEGHGWRVRALSAGPGQGTEVRIEIAEFETIGDGVEGRR